MYNPNEPRNEKGEWTSGSATSAIQAAASDKSKNFEEIEKVNHQAQDLEDNKLKNYLKLSGVPEDLSGRVKVFVYDDYTDINVKGEGLQMSRKIYKNGSITNEEFYIDDDSRFKGHGTSIFKNQVDEATKQGFSYINTYASGSGELPHGHNGYYTWARLGYMDQSEDIEINPTVKKFNKEHGTDVKNLEELMGFKSGQEYWKRHGSSFEGNFDLKKDSYSQRTLNNYIHERR